MKTLERIAAAIGAHGLLVLAVLVGLLLAVVLLVVVVIRLHKQAQRAAPRRPVVPPPPGTHRVHAAWKRFTKGLPRPYRRSLVNFEHFVVMGAAGSGKTKLVDGSTNWRLQAQERAGSRPDDPDLPVYLTSSAVIAELPAGVLDEHGPAAHRAPSQLWPPMYRKRAPTVVCVVDPAKLGASPPDRVVDLAAKMRAQIDLLSTLRGRPIEVRVVLSHLDPIEGYDALVAFCHERRIPVRVAPAEGGTPADLPQRVDAWIDEMRGLLPAMLTSLPSRAYRKVVGFLREAPGVVAPVKPFLQVLFRHEGLVLDPVCGGIYFGTDTPWANPLAGALEQGPGPDLDRPHAIASALLAGAAVVYLGVAFRAQHASAERAIRALEVYSPNDQPALELARREEVCAFTSRPLSWIERHPDFYAGVRRDVRKTFSSRIRDQFLLKRLRVVAENGTTSRQGMPMAARRSIFYLGLLHSDAMDRLRILDPKREPIWSSMLELQTGPNFIRDYLNNVDEAYKSPIELNLANLGADPRDSAMDWIELLDGLDRALADGVISRAELSELQRLAKPLRTRIARFLYDDVVREIAGGLDTAADTNIYRNGERQPGPLARFYAAKYDGFLRIAAWTADPEVVRGLRRVLDTVNAAALDVAGPRTLVDLVVRLEQIYVKPVDAEGAAAPSRITIDGKQWTLPGAALTEVVRGSQARQCIEAFISNPFDEGTFFGESVLTPVTWQAHGEVAPLFPGRAMLSSHYTQAAYDKHIRGPVLRLARVVERANVGDDMRTALQLVVGDQVSRYAARYREEVLRFVQGFDVQAPATEELRTVLAKMIADDSPFDDFVVTVDKNVRLDTAGHPLLAPIKTELAAFEVWRKFVDGGAGPGLAKYKTMLGQLLADLEPGADKPPDGPGDTETTQGERPYLAQVRAELRGENGSYAALVESWLDAVRMPESQRKAFRAPLRRLDYHLEHAKHERAAGSPAKVSKPAAAFEAPALVW